MLGQDWDLNLRATDHPEFDAWRWNDYWVPLDVVVEFKRGVYEMALTELARYVPRAEQQRNRFCAAACDLVMDCLNPVFPPAALLPHCATQGF